MSRKYLLMAFLICLAVFSISYAGAQSAGVAGSISGYVYDDAQNSVPGATVTLYNCVNIDGQIQNRGVANITDNPQTTGDGSSAVKGMFLFNNVPRGTYNLTVEKDGHVGSHIVSLDMISGTISQDVILSGYRYGVKPSAIATAQPTFPQIVPINIDQPSAEMPPLYEIIKILAMAAIGAQLVFCLIVLALFGNNRK